MSISLNANAAPLVASLVADAERLRIGVTTGAGGHTIVDAGIDHPGGLEAGLRIAEICMAGLGSVRLTPGASFARWPWQLAVQSSQPVLACLGSQYAGWALSHGEGQGAWFALGSGPGRVLAGKEPLFEETGISDSADATVFVLEVTEPPPAEIVQKITGATGVPAEGLTVILTPTRSLAGTVQIVARVLEVALHKVHELHFPLDRVVDGMASAPLPPPAPSFVDAMGRTNDAIIYGGDVHLFVTGPEDEAKALAEALPSGSSKDYGTPFAETFKAYKGNFYEIDKLLFSPARAAVTALETGATHRAGALDEPLVDRSFGA